MNKRQLKISRPAENQEITKTLKFPYLHELVIFQDGLSIILPVSKINHANADRLFVK